MSDNLKEKIKCTIPIKVDSYEELFREFDYRDVKERSINADLDGWIQEYILRVPYKLKKFDTYNNNNSIIIYYIWYANNFTCRSC